VTDLDRNTALKLGQLTMSHHVAAIESLSAGLGDDFWTCVRLLAGCQGLIWVTGVGTSAAVGSRFAHILTDCGARSMFLPPSDGLHGHSAVMTPEDVLVTMSRGGESSEVIQMARIANERNVPTVAFVHNTSSTLAQTCRYVLPIQSKSEYELMGFVATTSTVVYAAMCDALCTVVLEAKGYTLEQLGQAHPGGAVGQALGSGPGRGRSNQP
jgi:D-arabinose 5-phosphate isomerase GutQ